MMKQEFGICFDTETTGLLAPKAASIHHQPYITEIYMCKFNRNFEIVDELEHLINVPIPLPEHITRITKITDEMLLGKPKFAELIPEIDNFIDGIDLIVAHNLMFDLDVLTYSYKREAKKLKQFKEKVCTVEMSYPLYKKRLTLSQLHEEAFGEPFKDAHRAKYDVLALLRCYEWLLAEGF